MAASNKDSISVEREQATNGDGTSDDKPQFSSPHWLSMEEVEAKGIPRHEGEAYRRYVYKQAFGLETWYNGSLKEHTFETEFVTLSEEEVDALVQGSQFLNQKKVLTEEQEATLAQLKHRLDVAIKKFGSDGAFIKMSTRSPKDALYYRNDPEYMNKIRLAVLNELEIEGQMVKASFQRQNSFKSSNKAKLEGQDRNSIPKALLNQEKESDDDDKFAPQASGSLINNVLKCFTRIMSAENRVTNGAEAMYLLRHSLRVKEDLQQVKTWNAIAGVSISISVRRWNGSVAANPGMEFRGFVHNNELNALSQYDDVIFYPYVVRQQERICNAVKMFFNEYIKQALGDHRHYVIDFFVEADRVYVIEINPFHNGAGACLFSWREHRNIFMNGPFEFRVVQSSSEDCLSVLHTKWQQLLEAIVRERSQPQRRRFKCEIL